MAATFSNPRYSALPCELMRGCIFADDFVTLFRIAENFGTPQGSGSTADHGLVLTGDGYIEYDVIPLVAPIGEDTYISVKIQIKTTVKETAKLIGNANLISGTPTTGFTIWVDDDGVKANCSTSVVIATPCAVDLDYADGELHTITYVFKDYDDHRLYVDDLDESQQSITVPDLDNAFPLFIGGYDFEGTLYGARIFNNLLSREEHDVYHADTLTSFMDSPYACYRCDEFGDDSDGNRIWDRTLGLRDLSKADRLASDKFPLFDVDKYTFDLVDDYVDNDEFDLPDEYVITGVSSTPQLPYPIINYDNDTEFFDLLTTEGQFWGHLHSLIIHDFELTELQELHDEYQHLYLLDRVRASGMYHRLITEGTCRLAMFPGSEYAAYTDYSKHGNSGFASPAVTRDGPNGVTFDANTAIQVYDDPSLRLQALTIAVFGNFDTEDPGSTGVEGTLINKSGNYRLSIDVGDIVFNGSKIAHTFNNNQMIAVTAKDGYKPRFYVDGRFIGEGDIVCSSIDYTYTNDLFIGSDSVGDPNFTQYAIKQVYIGDAPLTERENLALLEQAQLIGVTSMESGNRIQVREVFTGTAVDKEIDPGDFFQLIDVVFNFNTLPTTSEDATIKIINSDADEILEYGFDPSLSSDISQPTRFDKRHVNGRKVQIDYLNTDARTITVIAQYQIDPSVA